METDRGQAVPGAVRLLVVLHLALLATWSLAYPSYLGYDEPQHVDRVVGLVAGDGIEGPGERTQSLGVARSSDPFYGAGEVPALPTPYRAADLPPRGERPSLEDLGGAAPSQGLLPNQLVEHPPLAYGVGAALLAVLPDDLAYDRTVGLLRALDVVLFAPLPLLAWLTAVRLTRDRGVALAAAALTLAVPGMTRVGAMWGNDALLVLATSAAVALLARVLTDDTSRRTGVLLGLAVAAALLTKGFALLLLPTVVATGALVGWRRRDAAALQVLLPAAVLAGVGLLWWLRNLVVEGALQPRGFGPEVSAQLAGPDAPAGLPRPFATWLGGFAEAMTTRFWGGLGVPDAPTFPLLAAALATAVGVVGIVAALADGRRRPALLLLLLFPALLLAAAAESSWGTWSRTLATPSPQGRYLYGTVVVLVVAAAAGWARLLGRRAGALPLLALGAAALAQVWGLLLVLQEFWGVDGPSDLRDGLTQLLLVSPWPTAVTVVPPLAVAVLAVLAVLSVRRSAGPPVVPRPAAEPAVIAAPQITTS